MHGNVHFFMDVHATVTAHALQWPTAEQPFTYYHRNVPDMGVPPRCPQRSDGTRCPPMADVPVAYPKIDYYTEA